MQNHSPRVRFAPSPTGPLHMGGVRTALFNYLFAKQHGGKFILRIEDTDSQRFVPGAEAYILESLAWCGIFPDEGVLPNKTLAQTPSPEHPHAPYRQSERKPLYRQYAQELVDKGMAYYAFDTPESLEALRKEAEAQGKAFTYNYAVREGLDNSLNMDPQTLERRLQEESHWVIRFKVPQDLPIEMDDLIRGHIKVFSNVLDDKVLWKFHDQLPTYHLANIVDDHLMEITHVIRGEEWLPSLPLHYLLYRALGWEESRPAFAHLSLLLKPDGKGKLSKRDGDRLGFPVFPLQWVNPAGETTRGYREDGYLPEAFVNMLALLGWNPGTEQELFSLEELIQSFSLERVVKSGARFNPDKAKWFNQQYLRRLPAKDLAAAFAPVVEAHGHKASQETLEKIVVLIKERATFLHEFWDLAYYFFEAPTDYDAKQKAKYWKPQCPELIAALAQALEAASFDWQPLEDFLHRWIASQGVGLGLVMNALRICTVGAPIGPGMTDVLHILGKEESLRRIRRALEVL